VSQSVGVVLKPAGLEAARGLLTTFYIKDPTDPQWKNEPGYKDWLAFMKKYYPDGNIEDGFNVYGYTVSQALIHVLKQCGNDLSRANIMKQAASIKDLALPMLLPGIKANTGPNDYYPLEQEQLAKFDGERWMLFGEIYDAAKLK
jgi:branched-chain amino acid transport system substrate-binding protein